MIRAPLITTGALSFPFSEAGQSKPYYAMKPHKKYFKTAEEARKVVSEIAQKYGITEEVSRAYFREYPAAFLPDSPKSM